MEEANQLLTIGQIAVALAGFAGIIATFQFNKKSNVKRGEAIGLSIIVNFGLVSAFFSFLPLGLWNFGMSTQNIWAISSVLASVNYFGYIYYIAKHYSKIKVKKIKSKIKYTLLFLSSGSIILMLLFNAFNIGLHQEYGPYFISQLFPLFMACYMFSLLLLKPIWRSVRENEVENLPKE
tara:strand:- start:2572 stop:3108 length:537 start_codon:yes stop_codon:yes gene_type:complete